MLSNNNLSLLWEALTETGAISVTDTNVSNIKQEFIKHAQRIDNENDDVSLEEKNKKLINEYLAIKTNIEKPTNNELIDNSNETMFEKRLRARQEEFKHLMEPPKPKTLTIGETITIEKTNIDIQQRLEEYQSSRNTEPWMSYNPEANIESGEEDNYTQHNEITTQFMNNLKPTSEINKRVSFTKLPSESDIKIKDILTELKELRRKVSTIIDTIENNEIEI